MKENLDISLRIANKLRKVFEYGAEKQKNLLLKNETISDELAEVLLFNVETFKALVILTEELIDVLQERRDIFGNEGVEIYYDD